MDAIGNVPIFLSVLKELDPQRQRFVIIRELLLALLIIIAFYFIGDYLLKLLHISQEAVMISGGIILFLIAIKLIFPKKGDEMQWDKSKEPFLVPLAIPLVSGPAVLAAVMLYSHQEVSMWITMGAILIAWTASTLILISSIPLKKLLGERGLLACEKLTGLLLVMIAVQMFIDGVQPIFCVR
ncbi:MAG: hypothetical protein KR126chlam1_00085 [Chlamydiae bacterium]|nr:hypothetical protein [Chlamydiota bacterium]